MDARAWVVGNNMVVVGGIRILSHRIEPNKCCVLNPEFNRPISKRVDTASTDNILQTGNAKTTTNATNKDANATTTQTTNDVSTSFLGDEALACYGSYSPSCAAKEPYGPNVVYNGVETKKWTYWKSDFVLSGTNGRFAQYDGNGYVLDFDKAPPM